MTTADASVAHRFGDRDSGRGTPRPVIEYYGSGGAACTRITVPVQSPTVAGRAPDSLSSRRAVR
jgi:hypothetical protein